MVTELIAGCSAMLRNRLDYFSRRLAILRTTGSEIICSGSKPATIGRVSLIEHGLECVCAPVTKWRTGSKNEWRVLPNSSIHIDQPLDAGLPCCHGVRITGILGEKIGCVVVFWVIRVYEMGFRAVPGTMSLT